MRAGASDFLVKPVAPERLLEALERPSPTAAAPTGELAPLSEKLAPDLSLEELVGAAPDFRAALAVAAKAARNRLPILIVGEPGTGKETFARAIHAASLRARGPLVSVDCKAVAANIIDSDLFGHVAGAFPGAFAEKVGKLVEADGGTLLLDEIGDAAGRDPGAARPRAGHRRSAPGRLQRLQFGRRAASSPRRPAARCPTSFDAGLAERMSAHRRSPSRRCATAAATFPALARHLLARIAEQTGHAPAVDRQ